MGEEQSAADGSRWLMDLYQKGENPEKLLAMCRADLGDSPLCLDKRVLMGRILHDLGRREEARRELEHVERLMQRGTHAYPLLADLERREGRLKQAARRYMQALLMDSRNEECWSRLREMNAALADALQKVFDLAAQVQEEALAGHVVPLPEAEPEKKQPLAVTAQKSRSEKMIAALEGLLARVQRIKAEQPMGAQP